jgi:hypothetical protein
MELLVEVGGYSRVGDLGKSAVGELEHAVKVIQAAVMWVKTSTPCAGVWAEHPLSGMAGRIPGAPGARYQGLAPGGGR